MTDARPAPRRCAYFVAAAFALWFAYDLMRMPVQVSDSFIELLDAQQSPSLYSTFGVAAHRSAYFRPMRIVQIKILFDLADGRYWLVYRSFHALLLAAALLLFTRALRVQSWTHFAAAVFALTVLTGLHTFRGTVREGFPINHFLEIVVFCLIALNLALSRGGWWIDAAAAATFVAASLTLESGLLVWVVVAVAWGVGLRGVSRRGVIIVTLLLAAYLWVRFFYLSVGTPGLLERSSGFGTAILEPDALLSRFGDNPVWFYAYNVATSMLSILFSDPDGGVFEIARAWSRRDVPPRLLVAVFSSLLVTGIIAWTAASRVRSRASGVSKGDRALIIFAAVLAANSVLSYAYTKHEIISVAGAFYAFAAFAAVNHLVTTLPERSPTARVIVCLMLSVMATTWAFRSMGVHHMLQVHAFAVRNDRAALRPDTLAASNYRSDASAQALAMHLRRDALAMRLPNPHALPRWADRWWGE